VGQGEGWGEGAEPDETQQVSGEGRKERGKDIVIAHPSTV